MKRRIVSFLMALTMLLSMLPGAAFAEEGGAAVKDPAMEVGMPLNEDDSCALVAKSRLSSGDIPVSEYSSALAEHMRVDNKTAQEAAAENPDGAFAEEVTPQLGKVTFSISEPRLFSAGTDAEYTADIAEAAAVLRQGMKDRKDIVIVKYKIGEADFEGSNAAAEELFLRIYKESVAHTGVPTEGDYLRWVLQSTDGSVSAQESDGIYYVDVTYTLSYYTTAAQEAEVSTAVAELTERLKLDEDIDRIEKIYNIYSYICANVVYDYDNLNDPEYLLKHTAYAALINGTAVCQGYAMLFYRLALEAGIDSRAIFGISHGENHIWNNVELNGEYYLVDTTWDAGVDPFCFGYFMKCPDEFADHQADAEYIGTDFQTKYPAASTSYMYEVPIREEGDFQYCIVNGGARIYKYTGSRAEVVIPAKLGGYAVTEIGEAAFSSNHILEKVTFPASLERINDFTGTAGAFEFCEKLREVVIPADSKLTHIGKHAFLRCTALTSITLPSGIKTLALSAFSGCASLKNLSLPEGLLKVGQNALSGTGLQTIHIPASCTSYDCINNSQALQAITVAEGNPHYRSHEGVLYYNNEFYGWVLEVYPEGKTASTYRVADFADFVLSDAFLGVNAVSNLAYGTYAEKKQNADYLKTLYIGDCDATGLFEGYTLSRIRCDIIPDDSNPHFKRVGNMILSKDGKTLEQVPHLAGGEVVFPEGIERIASYACEYCDFTEITLPESLREIGGGAFWSCRKLREIKFPETMDSIGGAAFQDCENLRYVILPEGITQLKQNTFGFCPLKFVVLPATLKEMSDQTFAFDNMYIELRHAFFRGTETQWNQIGSLGSTWAPVVNEREILERSIFFGENAFEDNFVLENGMLLSKDRKTLELLVYHDGNSVTIPNGVEKIAPMAAWSYHFTDKSEPLRYIHFPDTLKEIGKQAFNGCGSLLSVTLPKNLQVIGENAFNDNSHLCSVSIPESVVSIGHYAFVNCNQLNHVLYAGTKNQWEQLAVELYITSPEALVHYGCTGDEVSVAFLNCSTVEVYCSICEETYTNTDSYQRHRYSGGICILCGVDYCQISPEIMVHTDAATGKPQLLWKRIYGTRGYEIYRADSESGPYIKCATVDNNDEASYTDVTAQEGETYYYKVRLVSDSAEVADGRTHYSEYSTPASAVCRKKPVVGGTMDGAHEGMATSLNWGLTDDGVLTISGKGRMWDMNMEEIPWRDYRDEITAVVVSNGVTGISISAFRECTALREVTLAESMTSIGAEAFFLCTLLEKVELPKSIESIGRYAFYDCDKLTDITIPEGVISIGDCAFEECDGLTSISVPASVTSIESRALAICRNLQSIQVDGNNPVYASDTQGLFYNKDMTELLQVPGGAVACNLPQTVTTIRSGAFYGCENLAYMTIPESLESVERWAVSGEWCPKHVLYTGSETQWNSIAMDEGNGYLSNRTRHYNCNGNEVRIVSRKNNTMVFRCSICQEDIEVKVAGSHEEVVPSGVTRIFGADRYETAFKTAEVLKQQLGVEKFNNIVVACGDNFADALGGSYLAAKKNAPILLVKSSKIDAVKSYIKANLNPGGTVYLLGGTAAIPSAMDKGLDGFNVKRLAGATRYDTNLLILEEAGVTNEDILICTGKNFADSLSAAAAGRPILLVKDSLNDSQKAFLQSHAANKKYILGGTAAVTTRVENQAKAYGTVERIGGNTRYETSVLIAKEFFPHARQAALAYAQNFPDGLSGGALAYAMKAPLVLTASGKEAAAAAYAKEQGITSGVIFGGNGLISDKAARTIFQMQSGDTIQIG